MKLYILLVSVAALTFASCAKNKRYTCTYQPAGWGSIDSITYIETSSREKAEDICMSFCPPNSNDVPYGCKLK